MSVYITRRTHGSVGGALDYELLAQLHRPNDPAKIAAEIKRLAQTGLSAVDIAVALRIDMGYVLEALHEVSR